MAGDILKFDTFFITDEEMEFEEKPFQKRMVKPSNAGFLLAEFNKILNAFIFSFMFARIATRSYNYNCKNKYN